MRIIVRDGPEFPFSVENGSWGTDVWEIIE